MQQRSENRKRLHSEGSTSGYQAGRVVSSHSTIFPGDDDFDLTPDGLEEPSRVGLPPGQHATRVPVQTGHGLVTPKVMPPPQGFGTSTSANSHQQRSTRSSGLASVSVDSSFSRSPAQLPAATHLFPIDGSGISKPLFTCSTNNLYDLMALLGFELAEEKKPSKARLLLFLIRLHGDPSSISFNDSLDGKGWQFSPGFDALPESAANSAFYDAAFPPPPASAAAGDTPAAASDSEPVSPLVEGTAEPTAVPSE